MEGGGEEEERDDDDDDDDDDDGVHSSLTHCFTDSSISGKGSSGFITR